MKYVVVFMAAFSMSACAQTKPALVNTYVFLQEKTPGTIPVDENGVALRSGPTLTYFAVIETAAGAQPLFDKMMIDGKIFSVSAAEVASPFKVGMDKQADHPVTITAIKKDDQLWQLSLQEDDGGKPSANTKKSGSVNLILKGTFKGKRFSIPVSAQIETLASPLYM